MYLTIASALAVLFSSSWLVRGETVQYCEQRDSWETNFCVAANTFHNATSGGEDLYMSLSTLFPRGNGWLALGTGYMMHQSLMFVTYPSADSHGTTLSLRTTTYHSPPEQIAASKAPDVRIAENTINPDGFHTISFVCYDCANWAGVGLNVDSSSQPWVWASNFWQGPSSDPARPLSKHTDYSVFFTNMAKGHSTAGGIASYPEISRSRKSINASPDSEAATTSSNRTPKMYIIHGMLMCATFGAFFPSGVIALSIGSKSAVRLHGIIQCVSALLALVGISAPFVRAWRQGTLFGLHQALGSILGLGLCAQVYLGYTHHQRYLKAQKQNALPVSRSLINSHIWLGRTIWVSGIVNAFMGLRMASAPSFVQLSWVLLGLADTAGYVLLKLRKRERWVEVSTGGQVEENCFVVGEEEVESVDGASDDDDEKTVTGSDG